MSANGRRIFFICCALVCVINCIVALLAAYWAFKAETRWFATVIGMIGLAQLGIARLCVERANACQKLGSSK